VVIEMAWVAKEYEIGDTSKDIAEAKAKLRKIAAKLVGDRLPVQPDPLDELTFGRAFEAVLLDWKDAVHRDVASGRRPGPDLDPESTAIDWATKIQLGMLQRSTVPAAPAPPSGPRHAALVFRGTGGVINEDYVYRVAFDAGNVEVIYLDFPASMGGLPPGAPGQPSAHDAIEIGYQSAARWIRANPRRTFVLGGYSLGEIVIGRILMALFGPNGELAQYATNYVCSYHIGPPSRPLGGAFYGGAAAPGVGISSFRLSADVYRSLGPRACYLCHPDDMYGSIPTPIPGGTGDIMETVYDMVTEASMTDFLGTIQAMIPHLLEIVSDAGILPGNMFGNGVGAPAAGGGLLGGLLGGGGALIGGGALLAGGPLAMVPLVLPMLLSAMPGLIAGVTGGANASLTGPPAAAQAAIIGMKFLMTGTAPHIEYHLRQVWPGQTYIGLATQHVRDWAGRTPVRT